MANAASLPAPSRALRTVNLRSAGSGPALLLSVVVLAVLWEGGARLFHVSPYYLPPLSAVLVAMADRPHSYLLACWHTLSETLIGYVVGVLVGVGSGAMFFRVRLLREMFFPLFVVSQTIPVIAFGAIIVMVLGNTLAAKAVIAFYLTFFPVTVNTLAGLSTVKPEQIALLRSFGATSRQLFWKLQLPTALPHIFIALRLGATLALIGAMVGEWFGDTVGLGVTLINAMFNENVTVVWAIILCSAILGSALYAAVAVIGQIAVFWREEL
jgi:NitT/TauT family transport system permease protein